MGQARRKRDAKNGVVTWQTESEVHRFIERQFRAVRQQAAEENDIFQGQRQDPY